MSSMNSSLLSENTALEIADLPRMLYVGDASIEAGFGGSLLIYRLLQGYQAERLLIFDSSLHPSRPSGRLPGVTYQPIYLGPQRVVRSRYSARFFSLLTLLIEPLILQMSRAMRRFKPAAILTVAHGFEWMLAHRLAVRYGLPLHILIHDDWQATHNLQGISARIAASRFRTAYRQARSRLCISPYMAERYQQHYGSPAQVLYPLRDAATQSANLARRVDEQGKRPVTFAYAGSVHFSAYADTLTMLACALEAAGGRLVVYSPEYNTLSARAELRKAHVWLRPAVPPNEIGGVLRREADVLFVPMSFDPIHRLNMEMAFPSKLADYTATGLPLFIFGPPYCSAVRWAQENPGVAAVVSDIDEESMRQVVGRLVTEASYRQQLAHEASRVGDALFAHPVVSQQFFRALV